MQITFARELLIAKKYPSFQSNLYICNAEYRFQIVIILVTFEIAKLNIKKKNLSAIKEPPVDMSSQTRVLHSSQGNNNRIGAKITLRKNHKIFYGRPHIYFNNIKKKTTNKQTNKTTQNISFCMRFERISFVYTESPFINAHTRLITDHRNPATTKKNTTVMLFFI